MNDDESIWSKAEPLSPALTDEEVSKAFAGITGKTMPAFSAEPESERAPAGTRRRHTKRRKIFTLALAACLVIVLGATAFAATQGPPLKVIASWLGVSPNNARQVELLDEAKSQVRKNVSHKGTTMTVGEVAGDRNLVYVSLDVTSTAIPKSSSGSYSFDSVDYQIIRDDETSSCSVYDDATPDKNGMLHFLLQYHLNKKSLFGKTLRLTIKDLTCCKDDSGSSNPTVVVSGTWVFTIPLTYKDTALKIPDGSFTSSGKTYHVSNISLSAVSLHCHLNGPGLSKSNLTAIANKDLIDEGGDQGYSTSSSLTFEIATFDIVLKDGRMLSTKQTDADIQTAGASMNWSTGESGVDVFLPFGKIIDPAQIAKISFGNYTITMK